VTAVDCKVVISGPDRSLNEAIADEIFVMLRGRKVPAICIDPYLPTENDYIVSDGGCVRVCLMGGKLA
jgi:hypothetical protein